MHRVSFSILARSAASCRPCCTRRPAGRSRQDLDGDGRPQAPPWPGSFPRAAGIAGVVVHHVLSSCARRFGRCRAIRRQVYRVAGDRAVTEAVTWLSHAAWHPDGRADQAGRSVARHRCRAAGVRPAAGAHPGGSAHAGHQRGRAEPARARRPGQGGGNLPGVRRRGGGAPRARRGDFARAGAAARRPGPDRPAGSQPGGQRRAAQRSRRDRGGQHHPAGRPRRAVGRQQRSGDPSWRDRPAPAAAPAATHHPEQQR